MRKSPPTACTVLTAYQEVEDNLAATAPIAAGERRRNGGRDARPVRALQQAQYRYKAGLVTYLEVATSGNLPRCKRSFPTWRFNCAGSTPACCW